MYTSLSIAISLFYLSYVYVHNKDDKHLSIDMKSKFTI